MLKGNVQSWVPAHSVQARLLYKRLPCAYSLQLLDDWPHLLQLLGRQCALLEGELPAGMQVQAVSMRRLSL